MKKKIRKMVKKFVTRAVRLKRVKKLLDKLWSMAVRTRDGFKCLMCGTTKNLSAHHWLFAKGHCAPLAYNVCNGATLCYACHIRKLHQNGDGDFILRLYDIMAKIVGLDAIVKMRLVARERPELELETMESMTKTLQAMLDGGDPRVFIPARPGIAAPVSVDAGGTISGCSCKHLGKSGEI